MTNAVERHLVADSSKFGIVKAVRFSKIEDFDSIITEQGQTLRKRRA
jgi:DeoR family deoxyribose operon repressor